ncbi:unnamed protein product [Allacma fusca]|uniref:Uncharacterized protein n=1 Tax=Allacma fusca TaxID=39272 RepID=A0A8J2NJ62_9HEXA|nr:unnamed protein product [Allacma fusca]
MTFQNAKNSWRRCGKLCTTWRNYMKSTRDYEQLFWAERNPIKNVKVYSSFKQKHGMTAMDFLHAHSCRVQSNIQRDRMNCFSRGVVKWISQSPIKSREVRCRSKTSDSVVGLRRLQYSKKCPEDLLPKNIKEWAEETGGLLQQNLCGYKEYLWLTSPIVGFVVLWLFYELSRACYHRNRTYIQLPTPHVRILPLPQAHPHQQVRFHSLSQAPPHQQVHHVPLAYASPHQQVRDQHLPQARPHQQGRHHPLPPTRILPATKSQISGPVKNTSESVSQMLRIQTGKL